MSTARQGAMRHIKMAAGLRISRAGLAQFTLLAAMSSFALALLRAPLLSELFETIKLAMLASAMMVIFSLRPVVRVTVTSMLIWSFLVVVTVSSVYNSVNSPEIIGSIGVFAVIALYVQAINNLTDPEEIVVPVLYWFAVLVVITSLPFAAIPSAYIGGRFAAGFINTNVASGFLAVALVILSFQVLFVRLRIFDVFLLVAAAILLLLTFGRGSLIAGFGPVMMMLFTNWRQRSRKSNLVWVAMLGSALWFATNLTFSETTDATAINFLTIRGFEVGARELIIERHLNAFWHSPFIGAGAVIDPSTPFGRTSGESSYTDLLALSGGIGIALIFSLILRALWVNYRIARSRLSFYVLLSTLLLATTEGYFVSIASAVSMILWALLAMSPKTSLHR